MRVAPVPALSRGNDLSLAADTHIAFRLGCRTA